MFGSFRNLLSTYYVSMLHTYIWSLVHLIRIECGKETKDIRTMSLLTGAINM